MGRGIIQHPETKKYAIWSSVVDDFITGWLSEDELRQWQINDYAERIKEEPIKVTPYYKTYEECLHTIETYHGKERANEVAKGELLEICCAEPVDLFDYVDNDNYACALCKCPVPLNFGILIDKRKYKKDGDGFYHFHCNKCGLSGCVK